MNGEFLELYNKLKNDLRVLQTKFEERWTAHDKASDDKHEENRKVISKIFDKFEGLPCDKMIGIKTQVYFQWFLIASVIVGAIIVNLVGG